MTGEWNTAITTERRMKFVVSATIAPFKVKARHVYSNGQTNSTTFGF
jgi:hypothetical protein